MKKILLIGSDGQLGSAIKKYFINNKEFFFINKKTLDVTIKDDLSKVINKIKPDIIINCVAYTNVVNSEKDLFMAETLNVTYINNLSKICLLRNIKLIHFSSDYVYDGKKNEAYKENDISNPLNNYGLSKLKGDLYIEKTLNNYIIIRCSWLFSGTNDCFLSKVYKNIANNKDFLVDNTSRGNPTFVNHLVEVIEILLKYLDDKKDINGVFNFCSNPVTTWYNFAIKFYDYLKLNNYIDNNINIEPNNFIENSKVVRPINSSLDISKINKILSLTNYYWSNSFPQIIHNLKHDL
tara:strand:+ start:939 stop:1820 length:882 start_codon:yes stop_codon:yes gene_type:complete